MSTPHNKAQLGEIAKTVLMPGDPLRAKLMAETFLENPVRFNDVRNMYGYTGTYNGKRVSIMASGMGIPSIGIYSYELFKFYDVDTIIRLGSAGAFTDEHLSIFDTLLVTGAYSESTFARYQGGETEKTLYPNPEVNAKLKASAKKLGIPLKEGKISSSDIFYFEDSMVETNDKAVKENDLLAAEMESFGLFHVAKTLGKKAACILTITDIISTHQETTSEERRTSLVNMFKIALDAATSEQ